MHPYLKNIIHPNILLFINFSVLISLTKHISQHELQCFFTPYKYTLTDHRHVNCRLSAIGMQPALHAYMMALGQLRCHKSVMSYICQNYLFGERKESVIECEMSVITMTLYFTDTVF